MMKLRVNGMDRNFDGDFSMPPLWYLRDVLGLTGTKFGCGMALCGACTVHKNGEAIRSSIPPMNFDLRLSSNSLFESALDGVTAQEVLP